MKDTKTVFVGLSGGVDSSVAALRLIKAGYKVTGVFIKVWQPDFLDCNWEAERLDAMRVAAKLGIPFLTCDAEEVYKHDVADYFIAEYKAGRTPNPDVMCNKYVKFGAFLDFAKEQGADYVATGHYAQVKQLKDSELSSGSFVLYRGVDTEKDQSYFLWTLTQEQLKQVLLPVGDSQKNVIRQEAEMAGLVTAEKKDSQGICFLGHVDIPEFLSHYIDLKAGDVLDETGAVIGSHKGALVYTNGQRHGFTVSTHSQTQEPYYVQSRDITNNTVTVSTQKPITLADQEFSLHSLNLIAYEPEIGGQLEIQTRYRQKPQTATIVSYSVERMALQVTDTTESISSGQSCVLYRGSQCLGGGIIA